MAPNAPTIVLVLPAALLHRLLGDRPIIGFAGAAEMHLLPAWLVDANLDEPNRLMEAVYDFFNDGLYMYLPSTP
jgi:hypothetical protein